MSDGPTDWALPYVVRIERDAPPTRTDALEAAASGVLRLLTAAPTEWHDAIAAWDGSRIRKVVRRARGAAWRRAGELPCLDVSRGSAEVRVFPPVPVDDWPPELARLQVGGTELDDPEPPPAAGPGSPLVLLSPRVPLTAGKAMAQAAHAAQLAWRTLGPDARGRWREAGFPLAVRDTDGAGWDAAVAAGAVVVHDGGFTEVAPGTATALAVVPRAWREDAASGTVRPVAPH
ncbi:peptidyl-tRNA hydrolase [Jatrophihabitans fulvus]